MVKPNGLLVTVSLACCHTYTSVLSTWSSSTALISFRLGNLILRKVSRLYAFSAYPDQTSLPSYAPGGTTGSQEVGSSRSSRTKDKPSQISCAHVSELGYRTVWFAAFRPSSRTALIGEQPNPWELLHPRDDEPTSRCQTGASM